MARLSAFDKRARARNAARPVQMRNKGDRGPHGPTLAKLERSYNRDDYDAGRAAARNALTLRRMKLKASIARGLKAWLVFTPKFPEPLGYVTGYDKGYARALTRSAKIPAPRLVALTAWAHVEPIVGVLPELVQESAPDAGDGRGSVPRAVWRY